METSMQLFVAYVSYMYSSHAEITYGKSKHVVIDCYVSDWVCVWNITGLLPDTSSSSQLLHVDIVEVKKS